MSGWRPALRRSAAVQAFLSVGLACLLLTQEAASSCPTPSDEPLAPLIDDFDDEDLLLPAASGLTGTWTATNVYGEPLVPTIEPDPRASTSRTLQLSRSGGGFDGAYLGVDLAGGCPLDAHAYTGIRLKARLSGNFRLNLPTLDTTPIAAGGRCDPDEPGQLCDNHFGMAIRGTAAGVHEYAIPFSRLSQLEPGPPARFEPSELLRVELWAESGQAYAVWLDEIGFAELGACDGSATFEDELIDDFEDGDQENQATPSGQTNAFMLSALNNEPSLCLDCLSIERDPENPPNRVARVTQAETLEMVMGSLASGCRGADASGYAGIELKVHAAAEFTVVLTSLDGASTAQAFTGSGEFRSVRVPFGSAIDPSALDFLHVEQPLDTSYAREDMLVDDVKFYERDVPLGAPCQSDADCAGGECFGPSSSLTSLGAPAGGICSRWCTGAEDCTDVQAGSACSVRLGFCVETCQRNDAPGAELDPEKCHGRADMTCTLGEVIPADALQGDFQVTSLCQPRCSDAGCGEDLHCNPSTGLCQAELATGLGPGERCDPEDDAPAHPCAGSCDAASSTCRLPCTLGAPKACATGGGASEGDFVCLPLFGDSAPGDAGMCAVPCDCLEECGPGEVCAAVTLAVPLAHHGVCAASGTQAPTLALCPNGCDHGEIRACHGKGGCLGAQHCNEDESGYGECVCPAAPGASGAPGNGGAPNDEPGSSGGGGETSGAGSGSGGAPGAKGETVRTLRPGCGCTVPARSPVGSECALLVLLFVGSLRRRRLSFHWRQNP